MSDITIFHNSACGTSRNVLAMIRNSGVEPTIVNYLQTPPGRWTTDTRFDTQLRSIASI